MTKKIALEELKSVIDEFSDFQNLVKELSDFVADKKVIYSLSLDYGMGAIGICERSDEDIKWIISIAD